MNLQELLAQVLDTVRKLECRVEALEKRSNAGRRAVEQAQVWIEDDERKKAKGN